MLKKFLRKIFAFDRDQKRTVQLKKTIRKEGLKNVDVTNLDFLKVNINEKRFKNVCF